MARNNIFLFNLANGALKWDKLKQAVKDNENNEDFNIWDVLGDELGLDTNGKETNLHSLESNIGHLTVGALIEGGLKWDSLKQAIKEDSDRDLYDIWDLYEMAESTYNAQSDNDEDEPICCVGCGKDGQFSENRDGDTMCECCMSDNEESDEDESD